MPITQQIIDIASEYSKGKKVKTITLVIGDYSSFVGSSIQMYFDLISKGTICEGAKLLIERVVPMLICEVCSKHFERKIFSFECPFCGGTGSPCEIGKEFYIKEIEV